VLLLNSIIHLPLHSMLHSMLDLLLLHSPLALLPQLLLLRFSLRYLQLQAEQR